LSTDLRPSSAGGADPHDPCGETPARCRLASLGASDLIRPFPAPEAAPSSAPSATAGRARRHDLHPDQAGRSAGLAGLQKALS